MARRRHVAAPEPSHIDPEQIRRRYCQLSRKLRLEAGTQEIGLRLQREVAGIDDPAESLALAEAAYLTVHKRLPWSSQERNR